MVRIALTIAESVLTTLPVVAAIIAVLAASVVAPSEGSGTSPSSEGNPTLVAILVVGGVALFAVAFVSPLRAIGASWLRSVPGSIGATIVAIVLVLALAVDSFSSGSRFTFVFFALVVTSALTFGFFPPSVNRLVALVSGSVLAMIPVPDDLTGNWAIVIAISQIMTVTVSTFVVVAMSTHADREDRVVSVSIPGYRRSVFSGWRT